MTNVNISNSFESQEGSLIGGGGLYCSLENSERLVVKNCKWSNCISKNGNGGGASIKMNGESVVKFGEDASTILMEKCNGKKGGGLYIELNSADKLTLSSVTFSGCAADQGNKYFIVYSDLKTIATTLLAQNILKASDDIEDAVGSITTTSTDYIPLVYYLWTIGDSLYVQKGTPKYEEYCGVISYPCSNIYNAFKKIKNDSCSILILSNELSAGTNAFDIKNDITICPDGTKATTVKLGVNTVTDNVLFKFTESKTLTINKLTFELGQSDPSLCVFSITQGKIVLSDCHFIRANNPTNTLTKSLIEVKGGSAELKDGCIFEGISFLSVSAVSVTDGTFIMNGGSFTSISNSGSGGVINEEPSNSKHVSVTLEGVAFNGCSSSGSNGGAISSILKETGNTDNNYDSLIIKGCTFVGCSALSGLGGGIYCDISEYGELNIDDVPATSINSDGEPVHCKIGNCKVAEDNIGDDDQKGSKGRGGGVYIRANSIDSKIKLNNIIFGNKKSEDNFDINDEDKKNCGVEDHNMFLYMINLNKFYEDNKGFINNYPFNENDKNDIAGVGSSDYSYIVWIGYFVVGVSEELEVEEGGIDVDGCGSELFPCKSLEKAFERQSKDKKVFVKSSVIIEKDILFKDYSYLIDGKDKKGSLKRKNNVKYLNINIGSKEEYDSVFNSKVDVTFNYLTFSLPLSLNERGSLFEHSPLSSSSSTLTLSNCIFEKKNGEGMMENEEKESINIDYGLINVISGNIHINNISISDLKFTKSVIVVEDNVVNFDVNYIILYNEEFNNGLFEIKVKNNEIRNINVINLNIDGIILNNYPLFIYNKSSPSSSLFSIESKRNEESSKLSLSNCNFKNILHDREGESNILFSSSISLSPSLELNESIFNNITLTPDRNTGSILSISSYSSYMNNCSFNGKEEEQQQNEEKICSWDGSIIEVSKGVGMFDGCIIANSSKGGINIKEGSNVTIKGCIFDNNNPKYTKYGSVRRNIICSSSTLKGEEMKEEENDSLWILNNKCTFEGLDQYSSLLFIPSISNVSYIDEVNENNTVNVTFEGNLLVPCNLSLKVIESDEENPSINSFTYSFSSFENENRSYSFISYPFLFTSDSSHSLSVSLLYPDGREGKIVESDPYIFREGKNSDDEGGGNDKDKDKTKEKSGSLVWIIIGSVSGFVIILIIIIIIIVIVVCKKRSVPSEEEKKEEEMMEGMEVKEEIAIKPWNEEDDSQYNSSTEQSSRMTINQAFEEEK